MKTLVTDGIHSGYSNFRNEYDIQLSCEEKKAYFMSGEATNEINFLHFTICNKWDIHDKNAFSYYYIQFDG